MKIYVLRKYDYDQPKIIGIFNNVEDLKQAVDKIVDDAPPFWWLTREKVLSEYGVEVYDLNATYKREPDGIRPDEFFQNYHE